MTPPDVTVVIPAFDPGPMLGDAVRSVMGQTYPHWQILVVDDGSSQDLLSYLPPDLDRERLRILRHPENRGQAAALNTALSHVTTRYFLQVDADDLLLPEAIQLLRDALESAPDRVAMASANMLITFTDGREPVVRRGGAYQNRYRLLLRNAALWPRFYRTASLRRVGGWPKGGPFQGRYLEDRRMLYRLIESYHLAWVDQVVYIYRRHGNNMTMRHAGEHNAVARWLIESCLRRWGNRYRPVYRYDNGVLLLAQLRPSRRVRQHQARSPGRSWRKSAHVRRTSPRQGKARSR